MTSNAKALETFLTYFKLFEQDNTSDIFATVIVDSEYRQIAHSNNLANFYNSNEFKSQLENAIGKHVINDIFRLHPNKKNIQLIFDKIKENSCRSLSAVGIDFNRKPEYLLMHFDYIPLVNKDTNDFMGIKIRISKPKVTLYYKTLLMKMSNMFDIAPKPINKQNREIELLFLLCHLSTNIEIATYLNLCGGAHIVTAGAIHKFITRNLYAKFGVDNLNSLKKKAIQLGYHRVPPQNLLQSSLILVDEI